MNHCYISRGALFNDFFPTMTLCYSFLECVMSSLQPDNRAQPPQQGKFPQ